MKKVWKVLLFCMLMGIFSIPAAASVNEQELYVVDTCPVTDTKTIAVNPLIRKDENYPGNNNRGLSYDIELLSRFEAFMKEQLINASKSENKYVDVLSVTELRNMEMFECIDPWSFGGYTPYIMRVEFGDGATHKHPYKMGFEYLVWDGNAELDNANIAGWRIHNALSEEETLAYFAEVDKAVKTALDAAPEDATDETLALFYHDYIAYKCEYDYDRLEDDILPMESHTSGGVLTTDIGVCDGFSNTYSYLLHKFGIECDLVISWEINHAWNIIKLNNEFYHVDITWDDPVRDRLGQVVHSYFLISDAKMLEQDHALGNEEGYDYTCDDTRYEDAFWRKACSKVWMDGSMVYYATYDYDKFYDGVNGIYARNMEDGSVKQLVSIPGKFVDDVSWWASNCAGLFLDGEYLYYNTEREIRKVKTDGTDNQLVYSLGDQVGYIYGSKTLGKEIKYFVAPSSAAIEERDGGVYYYCCLHKNVKEDTAKPATCTTGGSKQVTCKDCNETWTEDVDPLQHDWNKGYTVDKKPTYIEKGLESIHCKRCDVSKEGTSREIDILPNPFTDITEGLYCKTAVLWAYSNNITTGTSVEGIFDPRGACTRAQVVTFLWRVAGKPEPQYTKWNITDVAYSSGSDYDKAIHWAYEQGVAAGYPDNTFRPKDPVTRAQFVTFLYRMADSPEVNVNDGSFDDVDPIRHKNFQNAIVWATKRGVASGRNGKFMPDTVASRGDVLTFIYRDEILP